MHGLRELGVRTERFFKIKCQFECAVPVLINDPSVGIHLYRIAQEAVSNAIKHGQAHKVSIGLFHEAQGICLEVHDNGIGFREPARGNQGMGLHIMRHRASMVGGTFSIQRDEVGTVVTCRVGLEEEKEAA